MTRGIIRFLSSTAIFAFAAGAGLWLAPQPAVSTPNTMAGERRVDPAPQYLEVAEAVASGLPAVAQSGSGPGDVSVGASA